MNEKAKERKAAFTAAFPYTLPVLTGFTVLGITYGILMETKGYGIIYIFLMSAVAFCGSMQFAAITLLTSAFNPLGALLLSIMVNARHIFYGLSMLQKYKGLGKIRPFLIYTLCDETFSICSSVNVPENINRRLFYFFISALDYLYWIIGSVIGGILGGTVSFNTKGLDFALTALFVVLFLDSMKEKKNIIPGIIGVSAAVFSVVAFGSQNMVIPSMIIILIVLLLGRNKL